MIIRQFFDKFTAHSSYLIGSGSGKRSSLGCSILKMNGFTDVLMQAVLMPISATKAGNK